MLNKLRSFSSLYMLMMVTSLSKFFGFFRDLVLSYFWGASEVSDAFVIANTIPGTICNLLIQAVAVGFIPVYTAIKVRNNEKETQEFVNGMLELLLVCCLPLFILVFLFPSVVIKIFAYGFNSEALNLSVIFLRITIISVFSKVVVSVLSAYLQVNKHFIAVASLGIPFDLLIIAGIVLSAKADEVFLPIGILLGGFCEAVIVIICSRRIQFKFRLTKNVFSHDIKKVVKMLVPLIMIVGVNQLNVLTDRLFASYIQTGAITILDYSNKVCLMIENVVVNSIAAVLYTSLSELFVAKDDKGFSDALVQSANKIVKYLIPSTCLISCASLSIITLLFDRGAFTAQNVNDTAACMAFYSIGIVFVGYRTIYTRALYSTNRIKEVTVISIISLLFNVICNFIFSRFIGIEGLALATSLSSLVSTVLMYIAIKKNNSFIKPFELKSIVSTVALSGAFAILLLMSNQLKDLFSNAKLFVWAQLIVAGLLFLLIIYFVDMRKKDEIK